MRAISSGMPQPKLLAEAEKYKAAYISLLKAKLHWANDAVMVGTGGTNTQRAAIAQSQIDIINIEIEEWTNKSAQELLGEAGVA